MSTFKLQLLRKCRVTLQKKIELIAFDIDELNESMQNETKSSVGDKHETARARMQSEHEKLNYLMAEVRDQLQILDKIDPDRDAEQVSSENVVITDRNIFFLAIPLGKIMVNEETVYVISKDSPIAQKLIGLKRNDTLHFNDLAYRIIDIL